MSVFLFSLYGDDDDDDDDDALARLQSSPSRGSAPLPAASDSHGARLSLARLAAACLSVRPSVRQSGCRARPSRAG